MPTDPEAGNPKIVNNETRDRKLLCNNCYVIKLKLEWIPWGENFLENLNTLFQGYFIFHREQEYLHCLVVFGEYVADLAVSDSTSGIIFSAVFSECKFFLLKMGFLDLRFGIFTSGSSRLSLVLPTDKFFFISVRFMVLKNDNFKSIKFLSVNLCRLLNSHTTETP